MKVFLQPEIDSVWKMFIGREVSHVLKTQEQQSNFKENSISFIWEPEQVECLKPALRCVEKIEWQFFRMVLLKALSFSYLSW